MTTALHDELQIISEHPTVRFGEYLFEKPKSPEIF